jgi:hypothetical protein
MDSKLKEVLVQVAIVTASVLLALKIKEMMNWSKTLPPQKAEN